MKNTLFHVGLKQVNPSTSPSADGMDYYSSLSAITYRKSFKSGVFMCSSPKKNVAYEFILTSSAVAWPSFLDSLRDWK